MCLCLSIRPRSSRGKAPAAILVPGCSRRGPPPGEGIWPAEVGGRPPDCSSAGRLSARGESSRMSIEPMRSTSLSARRVSERIAFPFTNVPLAELRSAT
jgi:hypothetical protein